jgi:hypothetical protein
MLIYIGQEAGKRRVARLLNVDKGERLQFSQRSVGNIGVLAKLAGPLPQGRAAHLGLA